MSTYRSAKRDSAAESGGPPPTDTYLACSFCGVQTPHADLATFGARCRVCYDRFCNELTPAYMRREARSPAQKRELIAQIQAALKSMVTQAAGGQYRLSWAKKLQQREQGGEVLTITQKRLWREALRHEIGSLTQ